MSKQTEVLKLALEALEECRRDPRLKYEHPYYDKTITAIRETLAEQTAQQPHCDDCGGFDPKCPLARPAQQQEPVAWMYVNRSTHETVFQKHMRSFVDHSQWKEVPLYGEPLANHELQCVCGAVWCGDEMVHLPHKHPPASKPWAGLTQAELNMIGDMMRTWNSHSLVDVYTAVEAKLREKNT